MTEIELLGRHFDSWDVGGVSPGEFAISRAPGLGQLSGPACGIQTLGAARHRLSGLLAILGAGQPGLRGWLAHVGAGQTGLDGGLAV